MTIYDDYESKKMLESINRSNFQKKYMQNFNLEKNKEVLYEKSRGNVKIEKRKKKKLPCVIIILMVAGITATVSSHIINLKNDIGASIYAISNDTTVDDHTFKTNDGFDYDNKSIAASVLASDNQENLDIKLYNLYLDYNYQVIEQMNEVFAHMHTIISNNPDAFTTEQKKVCFYPDFQSYLSARGFSDLEDYKKKMNEIINIYNNYQNIDEKLTEEFNNIGGR